VTKKVASPTATPPDRPAHPPDLAIVGLGASAGGLEAFEQFFGKVPPDSGMAFVLVQHLDPNHPSILGEILQRATPMPVVEAEDQMTVEANRVYIIPPNRDIALYHGVLQLSAPDQPRGHRMPIDTFLRSLAEDRGDQAIGIILSGTGTDGTLGLRAIYGAGGLCLVQDPTTAKYDGMPTSAIRAGYATHVLPVERMAEVLLAGTRPPARPTAAPADETADSGLRKILMRLRSVTGHDFALYKKSTITRRIERRMALAGLESLDLYGRLLSEHPEEVKALFKELLINVTSFFRDPEAFAVLKDEILPRLFDSRPEGSVFRVWVAGGATGEEAYSIAMTVRDYLDETRQDFPIQIYSTDLDDDAIATARAGIYPPNIAQDVSPERLRRFFVKDVAGYRIKKDIRDMVVFAVQNVIKDPPFTKMDLVSCRNLMIYLETELQNRLIPALHYALRPGGVLFLSPSESVGVHADLFTPLHRKWKLYQAVHSNASTRTIMAAGLSWTTTGIGKATKEAILMAKEPDIAELVRKEVLKFFSPASVLTDLSGTILYVHGETGRYLRPAPGHATLNVVEMAREGLQSELRNALQSAASLGVPTLGREVPVLSDGAPCVVSLDVRPVSEPELGPGLLLISFREVAAPEAKKPRRGKGGAVSAAAKRSEEFERELAHAKANLQAIIESQQTSNEELKSTNEELQSTNEELQSTNEELETSKEELQSVNEELVTVNAELQSKIEQLTDIQNDMKNLLDNINVGTIFLDEQLVIRRFSRDATRVYRLVGSDVGRPLGDIKSDLRGGDLIADAQAVLDSLVPCEREMETADGVWYLVRIQPYRTMENVIEGVVLSFTDITKRVEAETRMQEARELAEGIVDTMRDPLLVLDDSLVVVSASRAFYQRFRLSPKEAVGRPLRDLGAGQWDIPAFAALLDGVLQGGRVIENYVIDPSLPASGGHRMVVNARRLSTRGERRNLILIAIEE